MAGDWLKFEITTPDKPETWQLADQLNLDPDAVVGKLLRVWAWFDQQTENGNAPSVTKKLLDRLVGVNGFCDSMISVGWMALDGDVIQLTNFQRHNGKTAKNRALTAKRVQKHKEKSSEKSNEKVTLAPLPREEKRRYKDIGEKEVVEVDKKNQLNTKKIQTVYNERLGKQLGAIRGITPARAKHLRARANEDPDKRFHVDWWERYFTVVSQTPFLTGNGPPKPDTGRTWKASFDWLINADNMTKILEGRYEQS